MAGIFVSYRRDLDWATVPLVSRALRQAFPKSDVFVDLESISPGVNFEEAIKQAIPKIDVLVVILSPYWTRALADKAEQVADPDNDTEIDHVVAEIETAFAQGKRVLPILIAHARMPTEAELPRSLAALAKANAKPINFADFDAGAAALASAVSVALEEEKVRRIREAQIDSIQDFRPLTAEILESPNLDLRVKRFDIDNLFIRLPFRMQNFPRLTSRIIGSIISTAFFATFILIAIFGSFSTLIAFKLQDMPEVQKLEKILTDFSAEEKRAIDGYATEIYKNFSNPGVLLTIAGIPAAIFFSIAFIYAMSKTTPIRYIIWFRLDKGQLFCPVGWIELSMLSPSKLNWYRRLKSVDRAVAEFNITQSRQQAIDIKRSDIQMVQRKGEWIGELRLAMMAGDVFTLAASKPMATKREAALAIGEFAYALLSRLGFAYDEMPALDLLD